MPTVLGEPYLPTWRGRYPHMLAEDIPIWDAFLDQYQSLFIRLFYDVRVGGVWPEDPTLPYNMQFMYYSTTAKRIDVIAELTDEVWIVEVAAHPGLRVTGQIMSYHALWYEDPGLSKIAIPVVVARSIDSDLKKVMEMYGIRVRLVA